MNAKIWIALLLVGSSLTAMAPSVAAHTCEAYDNCDASACREGENHEHTDFNRFERDESCQSTEDGSPPPPPECRLLGYEVPDIICEGP